MSSHNEAVPTPPTAKAAEPVADPRPAHGGPERIARLFRTSLRAGRVHPLQPMLQRYRGGDNG